MEQKMTIVRNTQVNAPESMMTIEPGSVVHVACIDFAPLITVRCAAFRLNQRAGWSEFEVEALDNGASMNIRRNVKPSAL